MVWGGGYGTVASPLRTIVSIMNVVSYEWFCYERGLLWTGLLRTCLLRTWSISSGLLWTGFFWTDTLANMTCDKYHCWGINMS